MTVRHAVKGAAIAAVITVVAALLGTLVLVFGGDEPDMSYRTLDYDATVQPDGDLKITQHIDVHLNERTDDNDDVVPWKQLYQQYTVDPDKLTAITDISVTDATTGKAYTQADPCPPAGIDADTWNREHANHWYVADVTDGTDDPQPYTPNDTATGTRTVEIGWNIPVTDEADSMRFDITMTFEGVATAYDDVTTFQWEPFGPSNAVPIGTVTGTVTLPDTGDGSLSRAWLHYSGTSETARSNNTLHFTAYDVRAGQHLDLVAMYATDPDHTVARTGTGQAADRIIADETAQEQDWHDRQRGRAVLRVAIWALLIALGIAMIIWGVVASIRSNRAASYHGDLDYWRDPPELSPASAAQLLAVVDPGAGSRLDTRQMSSTVLSLASKKAIAVRPGPASLYAGAGSGGGMDAATTSGSDARMAAEAGRRLAQSRHDADLAETMTITINPVCNGSGREALGLCESEDAALHMLETAASRCGSATFDLKQMDEAFDDYEQGYKLQERFETACANEFALLSATRTVGGRALATGLIGLAAAVASVILAIVEHQLVLLLAVGAPLLFGALFVLCSMRMTGLTDVGQRLAGQVLGLRRYLEDFSDFSDRGVADLTLWDRYLVYAAAFGISETVLRQLAETHPQLSDPQWLDDYAVGHLIYWSYRPYWYTHLWGSDAAAPPIADIASFSANVGNIGAHLDAGFADIASTIQAAAPGSSGSSGGSFSGGGFGGSAGGSGGGSFGGR